ARGYPLNPASRSCPWRRLSGPPSLSGPCPPWQSCRPGGTHPPRRRFDWPGPPRGRLGSVLISYQHLFHREGAKIAKNTKIFLVQSNHFHFFFFLRGLRAFAVNQTFHFFLLGGGKEPPCGRPRR